MTKSRLLHCRCLPPARSTATPAAAQRVDRIVAFGDSYADDGNLFQIIGIDPLPRAPIRPAAFRAAPTTSTRSASCSTSPIDNFAIGGALTNNTNTNSPLLPGFVTEWNAFLAGGGGALPDGQRHVRRE